MPLLRNQDNLMSKSFDHSVGGNKDNNQEKIKSVKWQDQKIGNKTQNIVFRKYLNSTITEKSESFENYMISDSKSLKQEENLNVNMRKSIENSQFQRSRIEEHKSSAENFENGGNTTNWVEDEMNILLGLNNIDEEIPK